jgi:putative protease
MELLAPAGGFASALAAFAAGADAVYLGGTRFSARASAENITLDDLATLRAYADSFSPKKKIYVTVNTLVFPSEAREACGMLAALERIGPDALIVQDLGLARVVRRHFPSLVLHASTQLAAHNAAAVRFLAGEGFRRVVLAREVPLQEVRAIHEACGTELEIFIHGALCYSLSGLCLFSALTRERSGNRGQCAYCCREAFRDGAGETRHPFSMCDLFLGGREAWEAVAASGACSLKIEGRMKGPLYVASVVRYYRGLLDGTFSPRQAREALQDLQTVFCREQTTLYALGKDAPARNVLSPAAAAHLGAPVGKIESVQRGWMLFTTSRALERHDGLLVKVPGELPCGFAVDRMEMVSLPDGRRGPKGNVFEAPAGAKVAVRLPPDAPAGAWKGGETVYCTASQALRRRLPTPSIRKEDFPAGTPIAVRVELSRGGMKASARGEEAETACGLAPSRNPERTRQAVEKAFARTGGTGWKVVELTLEDPEKVFAPPALLNELRRKLLEKLDAAEQAAESEKAEAAVRDFALPAAEGRGTPRKVLKIRLDQAGEGTDGFDEVVVAIGHAPTEKIERVLAGLPKEKTRLALPVWTCGAAEEAKMAATVRTLFAAGWKKWEAAECGGAGILCEAGVEDWTADATLYAVNGAAIAALAARGAKRVVFPAELPREEAEKLAGEGTEWLVYQKTPLFLSLTKPDGARDGSRWTGRTGAEFETRRRDGLWVTTGESPRRASPLCRNETLRTDLSWD